MSEPQSSFAVRLGDSLPDLLNRLRRSSGSAVTVELSDASSLLLTASEFRALQAAAARDRIAVTVATDDPLRQQLANMFNLPVVSLASAYDLATASVTEDAQKPVPEPAPEPETTTSDVAANEPAEPESIELSPDPIDQKVAGTGISAARSRHRSVQPIVDLSTDSEGDALSAVTPEASRSFSPPDTRKQLLIAAGVIGAVAVLYVSAFFLLTRATVALTLKREPISSDLLIEVAAPGAAPASDVQVTVIATPVTSEVSSTQTMNVAGIKNIGDAVAHGSVSLSNPTDASVTLEAGTQFVDKISGTVFVLDKKVEISAASGQTPSFAVGNITCTQPGTVGNRDVGLLSGKLDNGVYFSNRESPILGGTDKQVSVVSQSDIDALEKRATDDMTAQAAKIKSDSGTVVLASSIKLTSPAFEPDHKVDEPATSLTVKSTARVEALAYDPNDLKSRIGQSLASTAPAGFEIDGSSLQLSEPVPSGDGSTPGRLKVHVDGFAKAALSSDERAKIANDVAGKNKKEIEAYLATIPSVTGFEIDYSPSWLPHRMPGSAGRIDVEAR